MTGHPSHLALDRVALGARVEADVAEHVRACARCGAIVAERHLPIDPPPWLASVKVRPGAERTRAWRRFGWLVPIPLAAVALALALVHPPQSGETARAKGAPAVTVYVKRGDQVAAWDGRTPVVPGDRLRVGVRAAGYSHLSVASVPPAPDQPALLYAGPLAPTGETLLPLAFRVDERGRAEVLSVIASPEPIGLSAHADPPERVRERGGWTVRLQIPKEQMP
jgi:hypothetical protein